MEHLDGAQADLPAHGLISPEQQLLTGLAPAVERAADLCPAEAAVLQQAAILTGKRHTLGHALINNADRHFREAMDVRFAGAVIAAFQCVVEEAVHTVAVVLIVLGCVDATLCRNTVGAAWAVLETERQYFVAKLRQCGSGTATGQTGAYDNHPELPLVGGVHELLFLLESRPLLGKWPGR